jgi:hypothetical protein
MIGCSCRPDSELKLLVLLCFPGILDQKGDNLCPDPQTDGVQVLRQIREAKLIAFFSRSDAGPNRRACGNAWSEPSSSTRLDTYSPGDS